MSARPTSSLARATVQALRYASGYIELGLTAEAAAELATIASTDVGAPPVLAMRLEVAMRLEAWRLAATLATELTSRDPANEGAWIHRAFALRRAEGLAAARDALLAGEPQHGATSAILHYNLACYLAQLGDLDGARARLRRSCALDAACRQLAEADPDLAPLRALPGGLATTD
jgi:Flp pilus assembly protein TadD